MKSTKVTLLVGAVVTFIVWVLAVSGWLPHAPADPDTTSLSFLPQIAIFATCAFLFAWTTLDTTQMVQKIFIALAGVALMFTCAWIVSLFGGYFAPFPPATAIAFSLVAGILYGYTEQGSRKRRLEALFGRRISSKDFARLVDDDAVPDFSGTRVEASVLVCEVQNQRELLGLMSPEDHTAMTNFYLQSASEYLVGVGGYLDECTGSSLRVVFGAPVGVLDHATRACRAAVELLKRLDDLNRECDARWQQRFDFRMGINSGELLAAAYGGKRLANFSVTGPATEFARRLCTACGTYGARILAGPDTVAQTGEAFEVRPVEVLVAETGKNRRVEIYEVLAPKGGLSEERERSRDHFWRGVLFYREGSFQKAFDEFQRARITGLPDPVIEFYIRRVDKAMQNNKIENPLNPAEA